MRKLLNFDIKSQLLKRRGLPKVRLSKPKLKFSPQTKTILLTVLVSAVVSSAVGFTAGTLASQDFGFSFQSLLAEIKLQQTQEKIIKEYKPPTSQEQQIINVVKNASPAVVSVIATKDVAIVEQYYTDPFEDFFGPGNGFFSPFKFQVPKYRQKGTEKRQISAGTGFIVSQDGLIITNKHVVSATDVEYTVLTNEGEKYAAEVLARDPVQDLAVLKVAKTNLPVVKLGNSDNIQIGQTVIAIGNALGEFKNTVSTGVVSGLYRSITASGGGVSETIEDVIQTDAAINPGNSGGPLLNLRGEVIGVNVAMASGAQNIGFSIPVNKARKAIHDVKTYGKIVYPFLGVRYILVNKTIQEKNNLSVDYGALIARGTNEGELAVVPGSAADKAGIVENDIILEMGGVKINQENTLAKLIQKYNAGDEATLKILHKGEEITIKVVLEERE